MYCDDCIFFYLMGAASGLKLNLKFRRTRQALWLKNGTREYHFFGTADKPSGLRGHLENTLFLTKTNKTLAVMQGLRPLVFRRHRLAPKQASASRWRRTAKPSFLRLASQQVKPCSFLAEKQTSALTCTTEKMG